MSRPRPLRILLVVESFPPETGGGRSYRAAKLVKSFTRAGCRVLVLCGDRELDPDPGLLDGVDRENLEVVRARLPVASPIITRTRQIARQVLPMDGRLGLPRRLLSALRENAPDFAPDVVMTSSAPYEVHRVGLALQQQLDCCWVSDWRDPFTLNRNYAKRTPIGRAADRRAERSIYRRCDGVIFNTAGNLEQAAHAFGLDASDPRYTVCQNGYDPDDLPEDLQGGATPAGRGFVLGYIGGVRGSEVERRFVSRVLAQREQLAERGVTIRLVGNGSEMFRDEARSSAGVLELVGFLPQSELDEQWRASSGLLLFLPETNGPLGWVPQKLYSYLATGRPILGFVPPGEAREILAAAGGHVARDPRDYDVIEAVDALLAEARASGAADRDAEAVERFDQTRLFRELLCWLEARVDARG